MSPIFPSIVRSHGKYIRIPRVPHFAGLLLGPLMKFYDLVYYVCRCRFQQIWSIAKCPPDSSLGLCFLMTLSELPYPESRHFHLSATTPQPLQESSGCVWPPWLEWQVQSGETDHQWIWSSGSFGGVQEEGRVYSCLVQAYSFTSIAIESLGACGLPALEFLWRTLVWPPQAGCQSGVICVPPSETVCGDSKRQCGIHLVKQCTVKDNHHVQWLTTTLTN